MTIEIPWTHLVAIVAASMAFGGLVDRLACWTIWTHARACAVCGRKEPLS